MVVANADADFRLAPEQLPFFDKQHLARDTRVYGQPEAANRGCDDFAQLHALPFCHAWLAWRAQMHADGDDNRLSRDCADGACLCQRLSFADVVKGVNAASKRVPQFDPPALSIAGASFLRQNFWICNLDIARKKEKAGRLRPYALYSIRNKSAKVQIKLSQ